jgi:hypothetical protein
MKIRRNLIQPFLLPALLLLARIAQAQFTFTTNNGAVTITGYTQVVTAVTIPDTIDGLPVTGIADLYFADPDLVNSISIPRSVTNITTDAFSGVGGLAIISVDTNNPVYSSREGVLFNKAQTELFRCPEKMAGSYVIPTGITNVADNAFFRCGNLTNITIPAGVIQLGDAAFEASGLSGILIPASVTSIGTNVFYSSAFKAITVDALNPIYSSSGGVLFNKDQTVLVQFPMGRTGSYTIPGTVTRLGDSAFYSCFLTNVSVPTNVTSLGASVFCACYGLTSITIPSSITSIGNSDFYFCQDLTNVNLSATVTNIGDLAFAGCNGMVAFLVPDHLVNIGSSAFSSCSGLSNLTIPDSVTTIGAYAFSQCYGLTNFTLPHGVTRIEAGTFYLCENLLSVAIPVGITSIGDSAFSYSALTNFTVPDSVTNLGASVFFHSGLNKIAIGNGVTCISSNAFGSCGNLASATVGTAVKNLGDLAFYDCEKLTGLTLPDGVTNIGNSALAYCYHLTNAAIGDSVTIIGDEAFFGCMSLTDIFLPNTLTSIGSYTFSGCIGLDSITIPANVTNIADTAFANCAYLEAINVNETNSCYSSLDGVLFDKSQTTLVEYPCGRSGAYVMPNTVTNVGDYAFYYCENLTGISLSERLTIIGNYAFNNCQSLATITIPGSVIYIGDQAFGRTGLYNIYLLGNAPFVGSDLFAGDIHLADNTAAVYYMLGTTGWGTTFGYIPLVLWNPKMVTDDTRFGVQSNQFGFNIAGTTNIPIVVEGASNLASGPWTALQSCTLTNGLVYFSDPQWTSYHSRFYRIRSP